MLHTALTGNTGNVINSRGRVPDDNFERSMCELVPVDYRAEGALTIKSRAYRSAPMSWPRPSVRPSSVRNFRGT